MYSLEITLTNFFKKDIRVESLKEALRFISEFEKVNSISIISVKTANGIFSIRKGSIFSIYMKECN